MGRCSVGILPRGLWGWLPAKVLKQSAESMPFNLVNPYLLLSFSLTPLVGFSRQSPYNQDSWELTAFKLSCGKNLPTPNSLVPWSVALHRGVGSSLAKIPSSPLCFQTFVLSLWWVLDTVLGYAGLLKILLPMGVCPSSTPHVFSPIMVRRDGQVYRLCLMYSSSQGSFVYFKIYRWMIVLQDPLIYDAVSYSSLWGTFVHGSTSD